MLQSWWQLLSPSLLLQNLLLLGQMFVKAVPSNALIHYALCLRGMMHFAVPTMPLPLATIMRL